MARAASFIQLSKAEDERLRQIEQSPHFKPKVRLRAQVVRLNAAGWSRGEIARHTKRNYHTVCEDLKRYRERGVEGLADAPARNQPVKLTDEIRRFVQGRLQEERAWTCSQLVEAVRERFRVRVTNEAMRKRLEAWGYCWKRTRYVPCKEVDSEVLKYHRAALETLKRGLGKAD